jgi:hypothetical protein
MIQHQFCSVLPKHQRRLFLLFAFLSGADLAIFQFLDMPLRTPAAPFGIVSFELAGSLDKAMAIVKSWDGSGLINASFGLGFDFLFMPIYGIALSLGVLLVKDRHSSAWHSIGCVLGWGALGATFFDALENFSLFAFLHEFTPHFP